jgi:hypothetical protein
MPSAPPIAASSIVDPLKIEIAKVALIFDLNPRAFFMQDNLRRPQRPMIWKAASPKAAGTRIAANIENMLDLKSVPAGRWIDAACARIFVATNAKSDWTADQWPLAQKSVMIDDDTS